MRINLFFFFSFVCFHLGGFFFLQEETEYDYKEGQPDLK